MAGKDRDIRILPLSETEATHLGEGHPHSAAGAHDFIGAGLNAFGPLGYSLLRSEAFSLAGNRDRHAALLNERFRKFAQYEEQVRLVDKVEAKKVEVQNTRLMFWDLIGGVSEACEQLAAVVTAVKAFDQGEDIGKALLGWNANVLNTIQDAAFQDPDWWEAHLGIPGRTDPWWLMTVIDQRRRPLIATMGGAMTRLPLALRAVVDGYTFPVHRVAMKRKHVSPLLDGHLAIAPATGNPSDDEWLAGQIVSGALVVADDRAGAGKVQQIVIPVSQEVGDSLFECWRQANWLSRQLASATIGRAENPGGRPLPMDPHAQTWGTNEEIALAVNLYIGLPESQQAAEYRIERRTARVRWIAESVPIRAYLGGRRALRHLPERLAAVVASVWWRLRRPGEHDPSIQH